MGAGVINNQLNQYVKYYKKNINNVMSALKKLNSSRRLDLF